MKNILQNHQDKRIYDYVIKNIEESGKNYSVLTNTEIAQALNLSAFSVRDKVIRLAKRGYLNNLVYHYDENNVFFARKMFKGNKSE
jgi:Mn-dependent DtxR family transcriptional regulator